MALKNIEIGDYVIAKQAVKGKPFLMKVERFDKSIVYGIHEKNSHVRQLRKEVEIPTDNIVLPLGKTPHPGTVHGCNVSGLYKGKKAHPQFGNLYWFYKPEPEIGERIVKSFNRAYKTLKTNRLDFIVDPASCIWEIHPDDGAKYAGMYRRSRDPSKNPNRLLVKPEIMTPDQFQYVVLHELAHHMHSEFVTGTKLNGEWLRLYDSSIVVADIKKEKSVEILENLLGQESLPSDFKGQLDEHDTIAWKWIMKSIRTNHKLSVKELDILFEADFKEDIRTIWPVRGVTSSDLAPIVTEYATKNVRELFAEAVSLHLTGTKLPKNVVALVEKSLSYARSNYEKRG
jgi:hypothetical protein